MSTLIILAAGLGSRFGGNKQLAEFGPRKLTLMEYNILNAVKAGFNKVIFVIRQDLEPLFTKQIVPRLPKALDYDFVHQSLAMIPDGCIVPSKRIKPLGTAHAVWCCHHKVDSSFAVINADDYYGDQAFHLLFKGSINAPDNHLMVAFQLQNTLSDFGGVNRGLCQLSAQNTLMAIEECENILINQGTITGSISNQSERIIIRHDTLISMNCWLFTPDIFPFLADEIRLLLKDNEQSPLPALVKPQQHARECYLPEVVMKQISQENKKVTVLSSKDQWFGVTYFEDISLVNEKITMIAS